MAKFIIYYKIIYIIINLLLLYKLHSMKFSSSLLKYNLEYFSTVSRDVLWQIYMQLYMAFSVYIYIYTLYRDVNYSVVAISKRTRSNLTKRIRTRLSIARKLALYHCVTFSKTDENFVAQTRMNHRFIFKMLYIYHPQKKKKKRKEYYNRYHPLPNFRISRIFENILQSLSLKIVSLFFFEMTRYRESIKICIYISDLARAINKNVSIRATSRKTRYQSIFHLLNNNASIRNPSLHQLHALENVTKLIAPRWHFL